MQREELLKACDIASRIAAVGSAVGCMFYIIDLDRCLTGLGKCDQSLGVRDRNERIVCAMNE